jgi:flagellar hook-associated protein 3 FlgL
MVDGGKVTDPAKWNALTNKNYEIQFTVDDTVSPPVTYYDLVDKSNFPNTSLLTGKPILDDYPLPSPMSGEGLRVYESGQPIVFSNLVDAPASPIPDFGISVTVMGDPAMIVDPNDPTKVKRDSFSIAPSSSQSMFGTVAKLIGALESTVEVATDGTSNGVARLSMDVGFALNNLDQSTENVLRVRAAIGSRMGEIDSTSGVNEDLTLQYQQTLSQLQDLDYAKTISDLTRKQTDLQAAQQAFVRVSQLSLFNYL